MISQQDLIANHALHIHNYKSDCLKIGSCDRI